MSKIPFIIFVVIISSCMNQNQKEESDNLPLPIEGTWLLVSSKTIVGEDTTFTDYTKGQKGIKIINKTHFSFLRHDLNKGIDSLAIFVCGGGKFSLDGMHYTEYLEYCNYREWEGNKFDFDLTLKKDTLIQQGLEKVEDLGVDQIIIETYIKTKD